MCSAAVQLAGTIIHYDDSGGGGLIVLNITRQRPADRTHTDR